jgi:hypothetical protein
MLCGVHNKSQQKTTNHVDKHGQMLTHVDTDVDAVNIPQVTNHDKAMTKQPHFKPLLSRHNPNFAAKFPLE